MTAELVIETLSGARLPEDSTLLRDHTRPPEARTDHYEDRFDRRTLLYDAAYSAGARRWVLTAPRLLNLWPHVRDGLRVNGRPIRGLRRQILARCEQISLPAPADATVTIEIAGTTINVPGRASPCSRFAGLNCAVTVNRDNHLDWITDWARFHARAHGLNGIVLFDNGSTAYDLDQLGQCLAAVPGIRQVAVVSAPFPYGPVDGGQGLERPAFLQPALLNLARRDHLARARAVLNTDIDELVWARDGASIFDAAADRARTMVKIHGRWAYPAPGADLPAAQREHRFRTSDGKRCRQKWCAVPSGMLSRLGWGAHDVGGRFVKLAKKDPRFELVHCRGTSTGWKSARFEMPGVTHDPELAALMDGAFGTRAPA